GVPRRQQETRSGGVDEGDGGKVSRKRRIARDVGDAVERSIRIEPRRGAQGKRANQPRIAASGRGHRAHQRHRGAIRQAVRAAAAQRAGDGCEWNDRRRAARSGELPVCAWRGRPSTYLAEEPAFQTAKDLSTAASLSLSGPRRRAESSADRWPAFPDRSATQSGTAFPFR